MSNNTPAPQFKYIFIVVNIEHCVHYRVLRDEPRFNEIKKSTHPLYLWKTTSKLMSVKCASMAQRNKMRSKEWTKKKINVEKKYKTDRRHTRNQSSRVYFIDFFIVFLWIPYFADWNPNMSERTSARVIPTVESAWGSLYIHTKWKSYRNKKRRTRKNRHSHTEVRCSKYWRSYTAEI